MPSATSRRSSDADTWVRTREALSSHESDASLFTARLIIDVTPEQRARIKVTAFRRVQTVAGMLRELLAREFPDKTETRNERQRSSPQAVK